jgi:fructose-bisphosphate aldolase, class I
MTKWTAQLPVTMVAAPDFPRLVAAANALVDGDKGLLAIDESIPTCNKRFARLGIAQTEHNRRAYRELIVTTPGLCDSISGVILCDETIRQHTSGGEAFAAVLVNAGIVPGIKVDLGAKPITGHPGEKVTEGLDGLRERLAVYAALGARFANGGPCSPSARPFRAVPACRPTRTPWPATQRCVRKPAWFPSWNPKFS